MPLSKEPEAVASIERLIADAEAKGALLPHADGALLLGAIIEEAGLSWTGLQRYDAPKELLRSYAAEKGLAYSRKGKVPIENRKADDADNMVPLRKHREVQQRNAALEAENANLRAALANQRASRARDRALEDLIVLGGRISPAEIEE